MKILQICSAREIGGGERHLIDLTRSLTERGHAVYAALTPYSPLLNKLSFLPQNRILKLRMRNSVDILSAVEIARFVKKEGIEIIHAHLGRDYSLAAFASARADDTPYVLTRHVLLPLKKIHRLLLRRASGVIGVSKAVKDALQKQNIFDRDKITTIYNGIDIERFAKKPTNNDDNLSLLRRHKTKLVVGMIGCLSPIKGQEDFIRAAAIVASRNPDVEFVIVGGDKSRAGKNRAAIEDLISRLNLSERLRLAGWVDDVRELLHTFDVFVSPSRLESFGLAIVEAMAAGVPVVATMTEGAREIIEDGLTGRLVPVGDAESLAETINEMLRDEAKRRRIGANGQISAGARFSLEQMVGATERLYSNILFNKETKHQ